MFSLLPKIFYTFVKNKFMSVIKMTVAQYAECRKVGASAIRKAILLGHNMPGVVKREKFGNAHVLHVDKKILKKYLEVS